jgi:SET domain-containing protein
MPSTKRKTSTASSADRPTARSNGSALQRPYAVRRSPVHGKGVFATQAIRKGTRIIEYKGKRVDWDWASRRYAPVTGKPTHTFLFELDDGRVIDANQGGNAARWINHSCSPNCEAIEEDGRIYIEALRGIRPGEELGYDYRIQIEERLTPAEKKRWPCYCGSRKCRGTLLTPKRK